MREQVTGWLRELRKARGVEQSASMYFSPIHLPGVTWATSPHSVTLECVKDRVRPCANGRKTTGELDRIRFVDQTPRARGQGQQKALTT
jgi:hypothetical protein